jgi:hypothetical protein
VLTCRVASDSDSRVRTFSSILSNADKALLVSSPCHTPPPPPAQSASADTAQPQEAVKGMLTSSSAPCGEYMAPTEENLPEIRRGYLKSMCRGVHRFSPCMYCPRGSYVKPKQISRLLYVVMDLPLPCILPMCRTSDVQLVYLI